MGMNIVGITNCPVGIAHTYMAAEALENEAKKRGYAVKIDTQGPIGVENMLTEANIQAADYVIIALDKTVRRGIYGYTFVPEAYYDAIMLWCEKRHQWKVCRDWITLTHGTVSTLHYIVQEFCAPGDQVIVQTPGYDPFAVRVRTWSRQCTGCAEAGFLYKIIFFCACNFCLAYQKNSFLQR